MGRRAVPRAPAPALAGSPGENSRGQVGLRIGSNRSRAIFSSSASVGRSCRAAGRLRKAAGDCLPGRRRSQQWSSDRHCISIVAQVHSIICPVSAQPLFASAHKKRSPGGAGTRRPRAGTEVPLSAFIIRSSADETMAKRFQFRKPTMPFGKAEHGQSASYPSLRNHCAHRFEGVGAP
jgi:hypothetical protein